MQREKADSLNHALPRPLLGRPLAFLALLLVAPAATVLTAFGVAPDSAPVSVEQKTLVQEIPLPDLAPQPEPAQHYVMQERVLRGDTVAALFERLGIHDDFAVTFLKADAAGRSLFRQLVPGRVLQAETDEDGGLLTLRYFQGPTSLLEVRRAQDGFTARQRAVSEEPRRVYKTATIQSSLFGAADAAGIPDAVAVQLARIFSTDIDFHADLRKGDTFSVVYEMVYEGGELVAPGRILEARFVNAGREYYAVLFPDEEGHDAYYSLDGSNLAKGFLRSPVEFSRISSGFGSRFHPIFNNWRQHTGVDFAAPKGTRVLASADGVVVSAGWRGGYGNAIELRHGGSITTLYGHLSRFAPGIKAGVHVHQGEPIGFVGMTGWATGPHLHYEYRVAGVFQDPLRVALPKAQPVTAQLRARFLQVAADARAAIDLVSSAPAARFE
jgi:murein DD-endopeptidase MepM/ murein hydrolase activator NlpD